MSIEEYGSGYEGRLSNSAVQTAQFCTHRFLRKYGGVRAPEGAAEGLKVFDATTLGVLVHRALEEVLSGADAVTGVFFTEAADLFGLEEDRVRNAVRQYAVAVDATRANGRRYGTVYTAPEMTNYWKTNFQHVDAEFARLQELVPGEPTWKVGLAEILGVGYTCVQAELGSRCWKQEYTGHVEMEKVIFGDVFGVPMAGTVDVLVYRVAFDADGMPGKSQVTIIDYKTGRKRWTVADVQNSDQFCLYRHMLRQSYPVAEIKVGVRDLRHDEYIEVPMDAVAQCAWENRYEPKLRFADAVLRLSATGEAEEVVIPYGSGYSPGCPCEFTLSCPYTPDLPVVQSP